MEGEAGWTPFLSKNSNRYTDFALLVQDLVSYAVDENGFREFNT